jgi:hypothetical protein
VRGDGILKKYEGYWRRSIWGGLWDDSTSEMKSMIPHYVLLLSLFLGGIQGGIFAGLVERHFHFSGVRKLGVFLGCFAAGVILGFLEINTLRKPCQRK